MFRVSLFVAFRYIRGISGSLLSVNARLSFIGIFVATSLMVIILSIFEGFQKQVKKSIFGFEPHLTIEKPLGDGKIRNWKKNLDLINKNSKDEIESLEGMVQSPALIRVFNLVDYVFLRGQEFQKNKKGHWMLPQGFPQIIHPKEMKSFPKGRNCLIGKEMAINFNLQVGEFVELVVPRGQFSLRMGVKPNIERFRIAGLFHTGHYEYDSKAVIIALPTAQKLFQIGSSVQKIAVRVKDVDQIERMRRKLTFSLPFSYQVRTIEDQQKSFFSALALEKVIVTIIISLFIVVAMTGVVISTYHTIRTKRKDIGILKAMGMSESQILTIFTLGGFGMGFAGTSLGMLFGVYCAKRIDWLLKKIEQGINQGGQFISSFMEDHNWYNVTLIPADVYYFDHIPVFFNISDLHILAVASLLLSGIASFIPARYASKLQPIDIIRSS